MSMLLSWFVFESVHYGFLIPMAFFLVVPLLIISLSSVLTSHLRTT